jgi:Arc/MetJ family transcription regulator
LHQLRDVHIATDLYTIRGSVTMRTNIEIDDKLLSEAMAATGLSTKRATVEEGLRLPVRVRRQAKALAELKGLGWEGDLDEMRQGRVPRRL